jgi:hypothetical protein
VKGGGHFMIVTHAAEIDQILNNLLRCDNDLFLGLSLTRNIVIKFRHDKQKRIC